MLEGLDHNQGSESYVGHTSWRRPSFRVVLVDESCDSSLYFFHVLDICYGPRQRMNIQVLGVP